MTIQEVVHRIMQADTLEAIAAARQDMEAYFTAHPNENLQPIYTVSNRLYYLENGLRELEAGGVPMEEFYRLRAKRYAQMDEGVAPDPWPLEWNMD